MTFKIWKFFYSPYNLFDRFLETNCEKIRQISIFDLICIIHNIYIYKYRRRKVKENSSDPRRDILRTRVLSHELPIGIVVRVPRKSEHYRSNKNREIRVGAG